MATFSLTSVNRNFVKYFLFLSLTIIYPTLSFSEIKTTKIHNKIHVLNLHGNRFFLNEKINIKSGDYLSTREKPATIIFKDNTKLCFSSNSSLKIFKNKNKIKSKISKDANIIALELSISNKIGLNVDIQNNKRNKGKISFEFKDLDQLNKVIDIIKSNY